MIREAMLYEKLDNERVHCYLCSHHCTINQDKFGFCGVRQNKAGKLYTLVYGEIVAAHIDPIEKKPLYHFFPGSVSYSIAAVGCNFRCSFCQNWEISQVSKRDNVVSGSETEPHDIIKKANIAHARSISYTYTEPTIFFEYAYDTAKLAKNEGINNVFVTNGYMTADAIEKIRPYLDAANIDLKSFSEDFYKKICWASLKPVLECIKMMKALGIWTEVTTLLIPGKNDSEKELSSIAEFIAGVDIDMPWHISRFHPDYKYLDSEPTDIDTMKKARQIGWDKGLRYIYLGNILEGNDTYCYKCKSLLVRRVIFDVAQNDIKNSRCPKCNASIAGVF